MTTVHELATPAGPDDPDLAALLDAEHEVLADVWGHHDFVQTARERWGQLSDDRDDRLITLVVRDGRDVLGYAQLEVPTRGNEHLLYVDLAVRPGHRRHGLGSALWDATLDVARREGRGTVFAGIDQRTEPVDGPGTLAPATGSGRVDGDQPGVRFAAGRGLGLEQVDRYSVLHVPLAPEVLAAHHEGAAAVADADYQVVTWVDRCPDEWVDGLAVLEQAMGTDAPLGGLDLREEPWDAARVRRMEQRRATSGQRTLTAGAVHRATGTLAAFTQLVLGSRPDFGWQHDTLVRADHRGHRLGMLVKAANLAQLAEQAPRIRRVGTWNAEENAHMLAINVALGFAPSGGSSSWQRRL
ncbi:MAG: GNAT family N-acetyltransferase [Actinobacteria bacterium]|nr:GNAT family N-acetyltransferase [Actinomycetota bacterium]